MRTRVPTPDANWEWNVTKVTARELSMAAMAEVASLPAEDAAKLVGDAGALFVDVREPNELGGGLVQGAINVPRGIIEFAADPTSSVHKPEFSQGRRVILYCSTGGRSALATKSLQDMGVEGVVYVKGGLKALKELGAPTEG